MNIKESVFDQHLLSSYRYQVISLETIQMNI